MKSYIIEGIDVDRINKIVSFNSNHEYGINTSIKINPTYRKLNGFDVISIFKRNNDIVSDGNPLIYALKGIKGWKIGVGDIHKLLKQFIRITEKIENKYDTIITIPSKSELNNNFLYRLNKIIKADNILTNIFAKLEIEEVFDNYVDWTKMTEQQGDLMQSNFQDMADDGLDYFSFKYINIKLRQYIIKSMGVTNETSLNSSLINGKNVLVLDDTIATGQTISEFCTNLTEIFEPKSLTIITLFSALK